MNELLLIAFECLTVILPFILTYLILGFIYKRKNIRPRKSHFPLLIIFAFYLFAVFYFTGAGTIFDLQRFGLRLDSNNLNILPFSREIDVVGYALNVLLFVPFGVLLPLIWPKTRTLARTLISGLSFSMLIELSQLMNYRQSDIDDLIMNTLGVLFGFLLFRAFFHRTKKTAGADGCFKYEPAIYILAIFFGHFLICNELGLAKVLYGF